MDRFGIHQSGRWWVSRGNVVRGALLQRTVTQVALDGGTLCNGSKGTLGASGDSVIATLQRPCRWCSPWKAVSFYTTLTARYFSALSLTRFVQLGLISCLHATHSPASYSQNHQFNGPPYTPYTPRSLTAGSKVRRTTILSSSKAELLPDDTLRTEHHTFIDFSKRIPVSCLRGIRKVQMSNPCRGLVLSLS